MEVIPPNPIAPRTRGRTRSEVCGGLGAATRGRTTQRWSVVAPDGGGRIGVGSAYRVSKIRLVFVLIVGCGRVGSSVARTMLREGHEVSCLDEDPEAHARLEVNLDKSWEDSGGQFTVGTGLEEEALTAAGIERADAFIASTDGDNTNIVISQIAKRKFNVPTVVARILDPLRAEWYAKQGVNTVCPTRIAIEMLEKEVLEAAGAGSTS
jgi:trk system potassium uptake protein